MRDRNFFVVTAALAGVGAVAILSTGALGSSTTHQVISHAPRQALPARVLAAPSDSNPTADALHVFGVSTGAAAQARLPLSLPEATIEAGIGSDGLVCFDGTFPGRPQAGQCGKAPGADGVSGVLDRGLHQPQLFFGLVGDEVVGLTVTTDRGSYDAILRNGAFLVSFPTGARPSTWVASLADGSTRSGDLSADNDNPLLDQ
jgi:hypothetical protein